MVEKNTRISTLMATQNSDNVDISGGFIANVVYGNHRRSLTPYVVTNSTHLEDLPDFKEKEMYPGVYAFSVRLRCLVEDTAAGIQVGFSIWPEPPTAFDSTAIGFIKSAPTVQHVVDPSDQVILFALAGAVSFIEAFGTFTLDKTTEVCLQAAQFAASAKPTTVTNALVSFSRIA